MKYEIEYSDITDYINGHALAAEDGEEMARAEALLDGLKRSAECAIKARDARIVAEGR